MKTQVVPLWSESRGIDATLTRHVREDGVRRPAILVIPGGGYGCVCEGTEGSPIANRFDALGFQTFVLKYRVVGDFAEGSEERGEKYPPMAALMDVVRAMRLIRGNAEEWGVDANAVATCGFSAGGHLSAAVGVIADAVEAKNGDEWDVLDPVPNAMLLCYPVILSSFMGHRGSCNNFFGHEANAAEDALFSLERHVTERTPPAFLWTTLEDTVVPMENSLAFLSAMRGYGRPCELHVFPYGPHGMQLGYGRADIANWPTLAKDFLRDTCGFRMPEAGSPGTVVLTFDDCPKSHLQTVAPMLKKFGFGATFFVTRFEDGWRTKHGDTLLTLEEVKQLHEMGFEIGNHTWNHAGGMDRMSAEEIGEEVDRLDAWLASAGIPRPTSFAYPGGPYRENVVPVLKARGYRCARAVAPGNVVLGETDVFNVPSTAMVEGNPGALYHGLQGPNPGDVPEGSIPVYVYHGVPDRVHPWCNVEAQTFEAQMRFLAGRGYRVVALRDVM